MGYIESDRANRSRDSIEKTNAYTTNTQTRFLKYWMQAADELGLDVTILGVAGFTYEEYHWRINRTVTRQVPMGLVRVSVDLSGQPIGTAVRLRTIIDDLKFDAYQTGALVSRVHSLSAPSAYGVELKKLI